MPVCARVRLRLGRRGAYQRPDENGAQYHGRRNYLPSVTECGRAKQAGRHCCWSSSRPGVFSKTANYWQSQPHKRLYKRMPIHQDSQYPVHLFFASIVGSCCTLTAGLLEVGCLIFEYRYMMISALWLDSK